MKTPGLLLAFSACMVTAAFDQSWFDGQKATGYDRYAKDLTIGSKKAHLMWRIDATNKKFKMKLQVEATSLGWIGFGLAEAGGMKGADIFIGAKNGISGDFYGTENGAPSKDCKDDWTQTKFEESNSVTTVEAERLLDTKDVDYDIVIEDDSSHLSPILLAFGTDAWTSKTTAPKYHGNTGRMKTAIRIFGAQQTTSDFSQVTTAAGVLSFDVKENNYAVPTDATTYHEYCMPTANLPTTAVNILAIQPIIDKAKNVHHFVLSLATDTNCNNKIPVWVWAPGAHDWAAPTGTAIKTLGSTNYKNYHLQIHYDNPANTPSVVDSSGVKIFYAATDNSYQPIGMLQFGDGAVKIAKKNLTEGVSSYTFDYTLQGTNAITVIGDGLHMHKHGEKMQVQYHRGTTLTRTSKVLHYDFDQQGNYDAFKKAYTIKGGDKVTIKCTYNVPTGKTIKFGQGSDDEMCINFVMYYPEDSTLGCTSSYCGYDATVKNLAKQPVKAGGAATDIGYPKPSCTTTDHGHHSGGIGEQAPMRMSIAFAAFVVGALSVFF